VLALEAPCHADTQYGRRVGSLADFWNAALELLAKRVTLVCLETYETKATMAQEE
jgi:ADP-glucose pyrophosphorylase